MVKINGIIAKIMISVLAIVMLAGCGSSAATQNKDAAGESTEAAADMENTEAEGQAETDDASADTVGDTLDIETVKPNKDKDNESQNAEAEALNEAEEEKSTDNTVDLIFFMGQSNMSGCGGDAALAPSVKEAAGMEYRSVSDPTRLYPITEPFGVNENRIGGLMEYPDCKKGSLVSAFVNEYYELTGRKVIAVSASRGETTILDFTQESVMADLKQRYDYSRSYLQNNGYTIGHTYIVWLQGESDAIEGTSADCYKTKMDDFIRPFFIDGLEKLFFITPGRTIDYKYLYKDIIEVQKQMSRQSSYYALATSVLGQVSTEYMTDMYHYNQHVLNLVGIEAAKSVAYYTLNNTEKIVYDYYEDAYFIPDGVNENDQPHDEPVDLTNINEMY